LAASAKGVSPEALKAEREQFYRDQDQRGSMTEDKSPLEYLKSKKTSRKVLVTGETTVDFPINRRIGIISAEVAVGMNVFKDFFIGVRNFVGGRSQTTQNAIRDMRKNAYADLKSQASGLGGNAVIAVSENYLEIGNTGSTMLLLVVNGTAVEADLTSE